MDYTRDSIGNIAKMTSTKGDFAFVYDNNNQLINSTHPEDLASAFTYDSLGNRITDQFGNFNYDNKKQRLLEDWKYLFAYDNNGNLSSKILKADNSKVTHFIHNSENQLTNIREYNGATVTQETKYFYDAVGRRIRKEHLDYANSAHSFERKFQYDNQEILFELDGENLLLSTFTHSGLRTDDVLAVDKAGTSYFYLKDHLGKVNDIVDGSGSLVQHYVYSPFGKIIKIENASRTDITSAPVVENFYTFTGREFDKESGLYYYRARYYDSETGRFIQTDPDAGNTGSPVSFNSKYIYAAQNPIMYNDPSGRSISLNKIAGIYTLITCSTYSFLAMNITDLYTNNFDFSSKDESRANQIAITVAAAAIAAAAIASSGPAGAKAGSASYSSLYAATGLSAANAELRTGNFLDNFNHIAPKSYVAVAGYAYLNQFLIFSMGVNPLEFDMGYGVTPSFTIGSFLALYDLRISKDERRRPQMFNSSWSSGYK